MKPRADLSTPQFLGGTFRPKSAAKALKMAPHIGDCDYCQFISRMKIRYMAGSVSDYSRSNVTLTFPPSARKRSA